MDVCNVRFYWTAQMIKAKNTLLNVSCYARLTTLEILPTSCQHDTDALFHEEHVLQCVKNRVCNLNVTSEMSTWIIRVACEIAFLPSPRGAQSPS